MKQNKLIASLLFSALGSSLAHAQTPGVINVSVGSGWTITQDMGFLLAVDQNFSGDLAVTALAEAGRGTGFSNRCQTDIQGSNNGTAAVSTSAAISNFAFAVYGFSGGGSGVVSAQGVSLATGFVDVDEPLVMEAHSDILLSLIRFGTTEVYSSASSADILQPAGPGTGGTGTGGQGGTGSQGLLNQLVLSQGAPVVGSVTFLPGQSFAYSVTGDSDGSATLDPGQSVLANTTAFASADIFLQ